MVTAVSTEEPGYFLKLICGRMLATVMTARHFQSLVSFLAGSHDLLCKQEEEKRSGGGGMANSGIEAYFQEENLQFQWTGVQNGPACVMLWAASNLHGF